MKSPSRLLIILAATLVFSACAKNTGKIIGIKIYEYKGDYLALTARWKTMGINTAFISTSLAANDTFRAALKKRKIGAFIIFPVFQNPGILKQDSSLYAITSNGLKARNDWVEFVCPSRKVYRNAKTEELAAVIKQLDPDGISIDFIRQFVFWEMIYPDRKSESIDMACFCDSCLAGFSKQQGISIPDTCYTTPQKAGFILTNFSDEWNDFRCDLISSMVKEMTSAARHIKPGLKINIHVIPWREEDFDGANIRVASQDLSKLSGFADYISPMCYSQMLKRDPDWITDVVNDMDKHASGMILPSIQVYPYYIDRKFTVDDFKECIEAALKTPSRGVVFFSWPLFEKDSSRMEAVRELVKNQ